jgi:hypothetical protein
VGLNSLESLNLTKLYPYKNKNNKNKVKSKPLELYELAGKNPSKRSFSLKNGLEENKCEIQCQKTFRMDITQFICS